MNRASSGPLGSGTMNWISNVQNRIEATARLTASVLAHGYLPMNRMNPAMKSAAAM